MLRVEKKFFQPVLPIMEAEERGGGRVGSRKKDSCPLRLRHGTWGLCVDRNKQGYTDTLCQVAQLVSNAAVKPDSKGTRGKERAKDVSWAEPKWLGLFVQNHSANLCAECQKHIYQKCALQVSQGHSFFSSGSA